MDEFETGLLIGIITGIAVMGLIIGSYLYFNDDDDIEISNTYELGINDRVFSDNCVVTLRQITNDNTAKIEILGCD